MIKKTLYFGNPAYLSCRNNQLVIGIPHAKGFDKMLGNTIPVEDIGIVVLDHQQITVITPFFLVCSKNGRFKIANSLIVFMAFANPTSPSFGPPDLKSKSQHTLKKGDLFKSVFKERG